MQCFFSAETIHLTLTRFKYKVEQRPSPSGEKGNVFLVILDWNRLIESVY